MSWKLSDVQAGLRKGRGIRDQIDNNGWIMEKSREFQKIIDFCLIDYTKVLTVWITTNCEKILQEMGILDHLTCLLRNLYVGQEETESNTEQWTGFKLGKEYVKTVYCHSACLTSMQSTSCKMLDWMKHKLESRLQGNISITPDKQMTPPLWLNVKRN